MNYQTKAYKFNYPYKEALDKWKYVVSKKEIYDWHIKYTPWFNESIVEKMVEQEYKEKNKNNNNLN